MEKKLFQHLKDLLSNTIKSDKFLIKSFPHSWREEKSYKSNHSIHNCDLRVWVMFELVSQEVKQNSVFDWVK